MTVLRELWYCHVAESYPSTPAAPRILLDFRARTLFYPIFGGSFGGLPGTQNGSCGISSESSRRPLSNDIKFARIGVRTRELWLPEVGVSELFLCTLPMQIPVKRGNAIGEPRVPRRSRSHYLSNAPGLADQLVASRKDSAREGGSCAAYFCKVPDLRESELGLVRYGPASRVHRGVFGPFEGSFPIGIPAGPDKFLAIREFHVVHGCVFFPMCPGSQINLLRVRKTLCASVATSVGKFPELSAKPYFALHRGELGFARYDLANRGRRNVPYAKGGGQFDPVFGLVNGPVKPWSNLVNLGQTWSKALQTLGNVSRTYISRVSGQGGTLVGLETARSNLGQTSNLVNPSQTWTLIDDQSSPTRPIGKHLSIPTFLFSFERCKSGGSTVWNLSPNRLRGDLTWGTTQAANRVVSTVWNLSPNRLRGDLTWGTTQAANRVVSTVWNLSPNRLRGDLTWGLPKLQIGWFQRPNRLRGDLTWGTTQAANRVVSTVWNLSPNRLRGDLTWGLPKLQIGWFQRFGISVQTAANRVVSTVWNLSPNRLRGDLTWGTTQAANRVVSTVWNLSPNRLRGDLTWGTTQAANRVVSTVWNLSPNRLRGDLTWGTTQAANRVVSTVWNLSPNRLRGDLTWGTTQAANRVVSTVWNLSPNRLRGDLTWGLPKLQIGWFQRFGISVQTVEGCLTEVVVAEIVAGPHALDSCECMNIEGAMRAPSRWLLLCLLGRSALASHTLGLAIS
uniref:Uncharacterized protein n=1 Tax=Fagus sylvatica TaxID=28930 RepID=A0A2N9FYK9_FAGSY